MDNRLKVLIVDSNLQTSELLAASLRSMHRTVGAVMHVATLEGASRHVVNDTPQIIYLDPLAFDLDEAGGFILSMDSKYQIVFVLYMSLEQMRVRDHELYRGERNKLRRYFRLDKQTPEPVLAQEVEATLKNCLYDIELWRARAVTNRLRSKDRSIEPDLCVVVMSFSGAQRSTTVYDAIDSAVRESGYRCVRIDRFEHNGRITTALFDKLSSAAVVVADLTEARPNCYCEVGWAHCADKQVILTIDGDSQVHFDLQDYNYIRYESPEELKERLVSRILATVGRPATV
jgi:hypothetical protein